jgi:parallel beta-helix repeat protein
MNRKVAATWLSLAMIFGLVVILVEVAPSTKGSTIIYVDDEPGEGPGNPAENFTRIQDAINASNDGDTIFVYNGMYYENIIVNKTINLMGENKETTVIDGGGLGDVVYVCANWVNVTGLMVTNCGNTWEPDYDAGMELFRSQNCSIFDNKFSNNNIYGIYLSDSINNEITFNIILDNAYGICLNSSLNNNISDNNVSGHPNSGIYILSSINNTLSNNNISSNSHGISLESSSNTVITNNNIANNSQRSIYVESSSNLKITGNNVSHTFISIVLVLSNKSIIQYNNIWNSNSAIGLYSSSNNSVSGNNISNGSGGITCIGFALNNTITNNFLSVYGIGIFLSDTSMNNLTRNTMINNGIYIRGLLDQWNTHHIDTSNKVNGKPVYYWKNRINGIIPSGAGEVILANCSNIKIENQELTNSTIGIELGFSSNNSVRNNTVLSCNYGVYLVHSNQNNITSNRVSKNQYGIHILNSNDNSITSNNLSNNDYGIHTYESNYTNIISNYVSNNNYDGINIHYSNGTNIIMNNITSNKRYGINIHGSQNQSHSNNRVFHNNIVNNGIQARDTTNNENYWDNGYPFGGNFWSDYKGTDEFKGPDQDIQGSDGRGDADYVLDGDSWDNYPLMTPVGNCVFLYHGWNLISLPFIQSDINVGTVLLSISGYYDALQWYNSSDGYDHWKHTQISKPPELNDLNNIDHTKGLWIHITESQGILFYYPGTQPIENNTITLHSGWNMVGYPSLNNKNRSEALNNITFGNEVDAIWTYDAITRKWKEITEGDIFEIGKGYYIHAETKCEWEVPL